MGGLPCISIKLRARCFPDWPALDNIFVYLLYLTGPVMVVLVCALTMAALYGYARRGQWQAVACLITMLAYGYMESQVTHLTSDLPRCCSAVRCMRCQPRAGCLRRIDSILREGVCRDLHRILLLRGGLGTGLGGCHQPRHLAGGLLQQVGTDCLGLVDEQHTVGVMLPGGKLRAQHRPLFHSLAPL